MYGGDVLPYSASRIISLDGVLNFRDMGGYPTNDGRKVREGLFFRSASLTKMTEQDRRKVRELGIRTIFDYRDEHEATKSLLSLTLTEQAESERDISDHTETSAKHRLFAIT